MLDPPSLDRALEGAAALVTTAIGYSARKPGDTLASVDGLGNRNLIDAARRAKLGRFVLTSILTCELARDVPHFWQKKLTEDYLEASGVPFVSLRPGAFLNAMWWARNLKKGTMPAMGSPTVRSTSIHPDDVARCLALAVDEPRALGRRIDLGMDRPFPRPTWPRRARSSLAARSRSRPADRPDLRRDQALQPKDAGHRRDDQILPEGHLRC